MKFCPNCGNPLKNEQAKFCGKCGKALPQVTREAANQPTSKEKTGMDKEALVQGIGSVKENAQKTATKLKETAKNSKLTDKVQESFATLNQQPEKKSKVIKIGAGIFVVLLLFFGWNWFSTRDYRQAMATADSYFTQGDYPQAIEFYQQAHDEKPGDEKAIEMRAYSEELSTYWYMINEDEFSGSRSQAVEELETRAEQISDAAIQAKYIEAADYIKNSDYYQLEERIGYKYADAYGFDE